MSPFRSMLTIMGRIIAKQLVLNICHRYNCLHAEAISALGLFRRPSAIPKGGSLAIPQGIRSGTFLGQSVTRDLPIKTNSAEKFRGTHEHAKDSWRST